MNTMKAYKKIFDRAFTKQFPDWADMSPMDPMKVFFEGVVSSMSEIEQRQNRYVSSVLDSLPALFSFYPKKAQAPVGLFEMVPNAGATKKTVLATHKIIAGSGMLEGLVCLNLGELSH